MNARLLTLVAMLSGIGGATLCAQPVTAAAGFAVVELFTSEGCSSCPPADAALSRLSAMAAQNHLAVYALEWHVDYWDYLGWKDPYASHVATERQYAYSRTLPSSVYTPQVVMNGTLVPSWAGDLAEMMRDSRALVAASGAATIDLAVSSSGTPGSLSVAARVSDAVPGAQVLLALVEDGLSGHPTAGENAGQTLRHSHVVRSVVYLPGTGGEARLQVPAEVDTARASVVGLVQDSRTMRILAANRVAVGTEGGISGRVTDGKGHGLADVVVQACNGAICVPAVSGPDGSFSFARLKPGTWSLVAGPDVRAVPVRLRASETAIVEEPIVIAAASPARPGGR